MTHTGLFIFSLFFCLLDKNKSLPSSSSSSSSSSSLSSSSSSSSSSSFSSSFHLHFILIFVFAYFITAGSSLIVEYVVMFNVAMFKYCMSCETIKH